MGKILIVGGAGYIGSHMSHYLNDLNKDILILDDLSYGHHEAVSSLPFIKGCVGDPHCLDKIFTQHNIEAVMHFASFIQVGESVENPAIYYDNNVAKTITLLNKMVEYKVKYFIFSSTAATFGLPQYTPIDENHPQIPINPYGRSKFLIEQLLQDYAQSYDFRYGILRYFNAAGASTHHTIGECHSPETHLIPLVLQAASGRRKDIKLFGDDYDTKDGSCIRDYIHIEDLSDAHYKLLNYMRNNGTETSFNLGTGEGFSVLDIIKKAEEITKNSIITTHETRRAGDPPILIADGSKARELLGWTPQKSDITTIIQGAWDWEKRLLNATPFDC